MKYLIKKGKRYHSNLLARINFINLKNKIKYDVCFDQSCYYPYINNDSKDLNKLFGYGAYDHHINSVRFAWRPDFETGKIEIFAYWYETQIRGMKKICNVSTGVFNTFSIERENDMYMLKVNTKSIIVDFEKKRPIWRKGFPYFGGNNTAPNDMTIEFKKTK